MALPGGSIAFENEGKESCSIESFPYNHNVRQLLGGTEHYIASIKIDNFHVFPIVVVPWLDFQ